MDKKLSSKEDNPLKYLSLAFISLIFLIIILAVGTQLVFSPKKVTGWVREGLAQSGLKSELDRADLSVSFTKAQTTLTGSIFFPVGVRINNFKILSDNGCKKNETVFSSVVVPFSIFKAFEGKLSLGRVKLNEGLTEEIDLCPPTKTKNENFVVSDSKNENTISTEKLNSSKLKNKITSINSKIVEVISLYQNTKSSYQKVSGVLIYDWMIKPKSLELSFNIKRLKFATGEGELSLRGEWDSELEYEGYKIDISGDLKVFPNFFTVESVLDYKEGQMRLSYEKQKGKESIFSTTAENIPLSLVFSLFNSDYDNALSSSFLRSSWVTFKSKTVFDETVATEISPIKIKSEGDGLAQLTSESVAIYWKRTFGWALKKPSRFLFTNFKALDLLAQKDQTEIKKIMPEFGEFNSVLELSEDFTVKGEFEAKRQSFLLRSMGQSGYQRINSSVGDYRYTSSKDYEVHVSQIQLEKGEFEGDISYLASPDKASITINTSILKLNKNLWRRAFDLKELGNLSLNGQVNIGKTNEIDKSGVTSEFELSVEKIKNSIWSLSDLDFKCAFSEFLACNFKFKDYDLAGKLKALVDQKNYGKYFEDITKSGELTFEDKILNIKVYSQKPKTQTPLILNWSERLGTVLNLNEDVKIKVREI